MAIAEFAYNYSVYSSTCKTPFFFTYGIHPLISDILQLSSDVDILLAGERAQSLVKIQSRVEKEWVEYNAKEKMYYNAKHEAKKYKVGVKVWLSGRNIQTDRQANKLDYKHHGSFMISRYIGTQAYQLDLPKSLKSIHDVFHVSLLESYHTI